MEQIELHSGKVQKVFQYTNYYWRDRATLDVHTGAIKRHGDFQKKRLGGRWFDQLFIIFGTVNWGSCVAKLINELSWWTKIPISLSHEKYNEISLSPFVPPCPHSSPPGPLMPKLRTRNFQKNGGGIRACLIADTNRGFKIMPTDEARAVTTYPTL